MSGVWTQRRVRLAPRTRGYHLITGEVVEAVPEIAAIEVGILHVFIRHTSASLSLNENASPDVRRDMETWSNRAVPEEWSDWTHTLEGPDDMPAHVKSGLFGHAVSLPVSDGRPVLGTWQGIYLGEHRDDGGSRELVLTLWGGGRTST
jgi:secondary thiamine-phosphate synthase enzyme